MFSDEEFEYFWNGWSAQEESNYKLVKNSSGKEIRRYLKKGYIHFDLKFWFPERKRELKEILKNGLKFFNKSHQREEWWPFSPFLKILLKTPRYKYQEAEGHFDLETKIRPICFASHIDSLIFGFYSYVLTKKYELYLEKWGFSDCVIAYRSNLDGRCNIQFAKEVFDEVHVRKDCTAIALDIKGYFDHIDHLILKEKWIEVIGKKLPPDQFKIYKALTSYSYINKNNLLKKYDVNLKSLKKSPATLLDLVPGDKDFEKYQKLRTDKLIVTNDKPNRKTGRLNGIPQGSGMSAVLSNIYLLDFDRDLNRQAKDQGFFYRRYCDDILIVCDSSEAEFLQRDIIEKINKEYHLIIQERKVEVIEFRPNNKGVIRGFNKKKKLADELDGAEFKNEHKYYKSLQYLGFEYNGQNIHIRPSSLSRYFLKMRGRIIKTVMMAYSKNAKSDKIWKKQIFEKYSHLGNRNFLTYAYSSSKDFYFNAKKESKVGMNSPAIRRQLSRHFSVLMNTLSTKNFQRFRYKELKRKVKIQKKI